MIKNCLVCNKQFKTTEYFIKHGWGKTCSISCSRKLIGKRKIREYKCCACKKSFRAYEKKRKFCSKACFGKAQRGRIISEITRKRLIESHKRCLKVKAAGGYVAIYLPDHPDANGNYVLEHRLEMEKHIGRRLSQGEIVHHIDGDKSNNHISNLILFPNHSAHTKFHHLERHISVTI
jgi:hypothetical protein